MIVAIARILLAFPRDSPHGDFDRACAGAEVSDAQHDPTVARLPQANGREIRADAGNVADAVLVANGSISHHA